jgi:chitosanase
MEINEIQKATIKAIIGIFETGSLPSIKSYGIVTNIKGDTGGLTYGKHQTTLNSGNLYLLIKAYTEDSGADFAEEFKQYLDRLLYKDSTLANDKNFTDLLKKAAQDSDMRAVQDSFFERVYWQPAYETGVKMRLNKVVSYAILYDSFIHGSWARIKRETDRLYGDIFSIGEIQWIKKYNETRRNWLANASPILQRTVYRQDAFNSILRSDNWDLNLPMTVRNIMLTENNIRLGNDSITSEPMRVSAVPENVQRLLMLQSPMMEGEDVKTLQEMLDKYGLPVTKDGIFGPATAEAVRIFQQRNNLRVDGIVGPVTFNKLELLT